MNNGEEKDVKGYHHFLGNKLTRSEKVQQYVVREIMNSTVPNSERENSIEWEFKHSSSGVQIGRLLALKRNLNIEYAEVIMSLHDIYAVKTGKYKDHAHKSAELAKDILKNIHGTDGGFKEDEIELIRNAISYHSAKDDYKSDNDPWVRFAKDADVLDCALYHGVIYDDKPSMKRKEYFNRFKNTCEELGLPTPALWPGLSK